MNVLIGGTGFLGGAVAEEMVKRKLPLRCLVRKDSDISKVFAGINNFISGKDHIYLTICADVFSSAYAPGVSAPQPFGLHPEIVLKLIKHIISSGKVISCDIAEVSPRFDEDNRTSKLAAVTIFAIINTATGNL